MGLDSKIKKILMVFTLFPYPLRAHGVSVRYLPIIDHLSGKYEINLIIITGKEDEIKKINALQNYCKKISVIEDPRCVEHSIYTKIITFSKYIFPWNPPTTFISHNGRSVTQGVKEATQNEHYSAVIWVGSYLLPNMISALPSISTERIIVDFIDSPSLWAKRRKDKVFQGNFDFLEKYERWKIKKWESKTINSVDSVIYISSVDANNLQHSCTPGRIRHVIPNGINIDGNSKEKNPDIPSPNIGFLGNMGYAPNIEAVHWLYENVYIPLRNKMQNLSLIIVGRDPVESIKEMGKFPGVMVTGTVEEIWPYVNSIDIFVFPIRTGAGMKNKILEAMYAGKPVLTTTVGNEGIDAVAGKDISICRTPEEFQEEVLRMIASPEERQKKGYSAHKFVVEQYSWDKILHNYEVLINA